MWVEEEQFFEQTWRLEVALRGEMVVVVVRKETWNVQSQQSDDGNLRTHSAHVIHPISHPPIASPIHSMNLLNEKYPERSQEIHQLFSLLQNPLLPCPPCLYVFGPPSCGKTAILHSFFAIHQFLSRPSASSLVHSYTDLTSIYHTPKLLYESVLAQWSPNHKLSSQTCDSAMDFVERIQLTDYKTTLSSSSASKGPTELARATATVPLPSPTRYMVRRCCDSFHSPLCASLRR